MLIRRKNKFFFHLFFLLVSLNVIGQSKRGDKYYQLMDYPKAISIYKHHIKNHPEILLKLADCYVHIKDFNKAEQSLERYFRTTTDVPNHVYLDFAQVLMNNKKYEKAKEQLDIYAQKNPSDKKIKILNKSLEDIKVWYDLPAKYDIFPLKEINSPYSDFGAVEYKNGVVFVSERGEDVVGGAISNYTHHPYFGVMRAIQNNPKDSADFKFDGLFSGKVAGDFHTGPLSFNAAQDEIYFTMVESMSNKRNADYTPKIYNAKYKNSGWREIKEFYLNSDEYSLEHPSLSADGQTLYFTSNMPGSIGGSDIYYCKLEGDKWGSPINIGPEINTASNEGFPFIATNGVLYFASDGHGGLGGLDLFSSVKYAGKWSKPSNLKQPINSSYDDFSIYFKPDNMGGYFASNRKDNSIGSDDVFGFRVNKNIVNVSGKLLTEFDTGKVASGVKVALVNEQGKLLQTTETDSNGYFNFDNVRSDQFYVLKLKEGQDIIKFKRKIYLADDKNRIVKSAVVSADGSFEFKDLPTDLHTLSMMDADDDLLKPYIISGKIVNGENPSAALGNVKINLLNEENNIIQSRYSNEDGSFTFNNLDINRKYSFSLDDNDPALKNIRQIIVKDKDGRTILNIVKNEQGKFIFDFIAADKIKLSLMEAEDLAFKINLSGVMISKEDNQPIALAKVIILSDKQEIIQSTQTDSRGKFYFRNLDSDQNYNLSTLPNDPILAKYSTIIIQDNKGKLLYTASRKKGTFKFEMLAFDKNRISMMEDKDETNKLLSGMLSAENGNKIANATVYIVDANGNVIGQTKTDAEGKFIYKNLPSDKNYMLKIDENDPALTAFNTIVLSDNSGKIIQKGNKDNFKYNFISTENAALLSQMDDTDQSFLGKSISGKLLNEDGITAIPNASVYLLSKSGEVLQIAYTDIGGKFVFNRIRKEDAYQINIDVNDPALANYHTVVITDANGKILKKAKIKDFKYEFLSIDNASLTIIEESDFVLVTRIIKGKILQNDAFTPIKGGKVILQFNQNKLIKTTTTDTNGEFKFNNVNTDDNYTVTIDENDPVYANYDIIVMTDATGKELYRSERTAFKFNFIPGDKNALSMIDASDNTAMRKDFKGVLFKNNNESLSSINIKIVDENGSVVATGKTDTKGRFNFKNLPSDKNYIVVIDENEDKLGFIKKLILADKDGNAVKIGYVDKDGRFKFNILQSDQYRLTEMSDQDVFLSFSSPKIKWNNIYFDLNKISINEEAGAELDKIAKALNSNNKMRLQINSHADCRAGDDFNLRLSEKRMNAVIAYLVAKGVNKKQLKGEYFGERKPVNQCVDGVQCSEEEHKMNRRAEFNMFTSNGSDFLR